MSGRVLKRRTPDVSPAYFGPIGMTSGNQLISVHNVHARPLLPLFRLGATCNLSPYPLAYGVESRNKALGRISSLPEFQGFNLAAEPLNYDDSHYCHSREFRSNIVDEWAYWKKIMEVAEFSQDMWRDPQQ